MKIRTEAKEIESLIRKWNKMDQEARDYVSIDASLARSRMLCNINKHWTRLKQTSNDINLALDVIRS